MRTLSLLGLITLLTSVSAHAEEAVAAASTGNGMTALAAAIAISVAAFGGALAQGRIGGSAMEGIARNPQAAGPMFVPMILSLALVEALVILSFVIANSILG